MIALILFRQQTTGNSNLSNSNKPFNNIANHLSKIETQARQILRWLSPLERQQQHRGV